VWPRLHRAAMERPGGPEESGWTAAVLEAASARAAGAAR
jgi:hypothetical protein